ncbi:MAG: DUF6644 family protein [Bauldia sp.]
MDIDSVLAWIEATSLAQWMKYSTWGFPMVESFHVIAIAIVVGTIAIVDLRLLGFASRSRLATAVMRDSLPWTWAAFAVAVATGVLMFWSDPASYYYNFPFRIKILLLALAGINMLVFEMVLIRDLKRWEQEGRIPRAARFSGLLSLVFWIAIVALGRWIGFVDPVMPETPAPTMEDLQFDFLLPPPAPATPPAP